MYKFNKHIVIIPLACLIAGLGIGFWIGRNSKDEIISTKVVRGEIVKGSVRIDTFYIPADTPSIIADYVSKHDFNYRLFDNNFGTFDLSIATQYNRPVLIDYNYSPLYSIKTIDRKNMLTPFASVSYNTLGYIGVGGGAFYKNVGVSLQYTTDLNRKGLGISLMYKF